MSGETPFYAQGLRFSCARCSICCRHDAGFVFLSRKDSSLLEKTLKMDNREFVETYCRWVPSENGDDRLSLREKSNFDCVFWLRKGVESSAGAGEEGGCSVYEARPLQCRAFPFWSSVLGSKNSWNATAAACPGMNKGTLHSGETIKKWLAMRQNEPIISRGIKKRGDS